MRSPSAKARAFRFLRLGAFVLAAFYLLLLIPERGGPIPPGASQRSFVWDQDRFWEDLEQRLVEARKLGCDAVAPRIQAGFFEMYRTLEAIAGKSLDPGDARFSLLETNLFELAPLVAVCPQQVSDYASLIKRLRAEVKRQSQHWDMNSPAARERVYRLLFGVRNALEEVLLQTRPEVWFSAEGEEEPSATPSVTIRGVTLHSGDLLVSRGGAPTSALIARGNDYPGNFSHVALLHVDEKTGRASVIESHIESGVGVSPIEDYLQVKKLRVLALRLRADLPAMTADPLLPHQAASAALKSIQERHIAYDFAMDYRDHEKQFCSEVASAAYEPAGIRLWMSLSTISSPTVAAWLASLGVRHFETQEPSDLEYDPQLRVVAEWCDSAALLEARVADAVTDAMLEAAPAGERMGYDRWLLPFVRVSKAWSVARNRFGAVGPVPEGMSATTALRVKKYLRDHEAIAAEAMRRAKEFQSKEGYPPPYWELMKMAQGVIAGRGRH